MIENINIKIVFIEDPGYIKASGKADWTVPNVYKFIDEIKIATMTYDCSLILINMKEVLRPDSEMTRFYTGVYMSKVLAAPLRIAIYAKKEIITNFGETVAVNRGALAKVFDNEKDALEWLLKE